MDLFRIKRGRGMMLIGHASSMAYLQGFVEMGKALSPSSKYGLNWTTMMQMQLRRISM